MWEAWKTLCGVGGLICGVVAVYMMWCEVYDKVRDFLYRRAALRNLNRQVRCESMTQRCVGN